MDYFWSRVKWVTTDSGLYLDLLAKDIDVQKVPLNHLRCDEASEILGIWMSPNGNNKLPL